MQLGFAGGRDATIQNSFSTQSCSPISTVFKWCFQITQLTQGYMLEPIFNATLLEVECFCACFCFFQKGDHFTQVHCLLTPRWNGHVAHVPYLIFFKLLCVCACQETGFYEISSPISPAQKGVDRVDPTQFHHKF